MRHKSFNHSNLFSPWTFLTFLEQFVLRSKNRIEKINRRWSWQQWMKQRVRIKLASCARWDSKVTLHIYWVFCDYDVVVWFNATRRILSSVCRVVRGAFPHSSARPRWEESKTNKKYSKLSCFLAVVDSMLINNSNLFFITRTVKRDGIEKTWDDQKRKKSLWWNGEKKNNAKENI